MEGIHLFPQDDRIKAITAELRRLILAQKISADEFTAALFLMKSNLAGISSMDLQKGGKCLVEEIELFRSLGYIQ